MEKDIENIKNVLDKLTDFGNELEKLKTQIKVLKQRQWFFLIIIIFVLVLQLHQI